MRSIRVLTAAIMLLCLGGIAQALVNIETVTVGDLGNAGELSGTGAGGWGVDRICGAVNYTYDIGVYEVTAAQYTEFLNAKAKMDTYGLYNIYMDTATSIYGCNIKRTGTSGNYSYSIASAWANRPVNFVTYWDSCRFANWLGNGQGDGDTETGTYTLTTSGITNNTITRNAGAKWALTSEDEWYKAAYYKGGTTSAAYWDYATQNNTAPGRDMADASGNNANYYTGSGAYPIDSGKYTTVAGEFQNSDSTYGTFDQCGNVYEWNEATVTGDYRGLRGGAAENSIQYLRASYRYRHSPGAGGNHIGFRVAYLPGGWQPPIPEPSSLLTLLSGLGGLGGMMWRRTR